MAKITFELDTENSQDQDLIEAFYQALNNGGRDEYGDSPDNALYKGAVQGSFDAVQDATVGFEAQQPVDAPKRGRGRPRKADAQTATGQGGSTGLVGPGPVATPSATPPQSNPFAAADPLSVAPPAGQANGSAGFATPASGASQAATPGPNPFAAPQPNGSGGDPLAGLSEEITLDRVNQYISQRMAGNKDYAPKAIEACKSISGQPSPMLADAKFLPAIWEALQAIPQ